MNRYGRASTIGGPSRATPSTLCQKCLKKDIYECKTGAQERPYVSRPSRTQQMLNPKLLPKLSSDVPQDLLRKKGIADEQLAKAELERGRKRERQSDDDEPSASSKRMRSASFSSVSTISTSNSRSRSPRADYIDPKPTARRATTPSQYTRATSHPRSASPDPHLSSRQKPTDSEKKRRRDSFSSIDSYTSTEDREPRDSRERTSSRNTRRKFKQLSPEGRGRRTDSTSSRGSRRRLSNDRKLRKDSFRARSPPRVQQENDRPPPRERSMSPFSKRLALTQAMNGGR